MCLKHSVIHCTHIIYPKANKKKSICIPQFVRFRFYVRSCTNKHNTHTSTKWTKKRRQFVKRNVVFGTVVAELLRFGETRQIPTKCNKTVNSPKPHKLIQHIRGFVKNPIIIFGFYQTDINLQNGNEYIVEGEWQRIKPHEIVTHALIAGFGVSVTVFFIGKKQHRFSTLDMGRGTRYVCNIWHRHIYPWPYS